MTGNREGRYVKVLRNAIPLDQRDVAATQLVFLSTFGKPMDETFSVSYHFENEAARDAFVEQIQMGHGVVLTPTYHSHGVRKHGSK